MRHEGVDRGGSARGRALDVIARVCRKEVGSLLMRNRVEGFTLVELMVVVLIIGILVAVAVPVFLNASANAQAKTCQANQRTLRGAVQTALAAGETTSSVVASNVDTSTANGWGQLLVPKYVKAVPKCPAGTTGSNLYHMTLAGLVDGDQNAGTWVSAAHQLQ